MMPFSPDVMRVLLFACLLGMALLAALFLRGRRLSAWAYLGWGLLIFLVPLVGPFLVILLHPGRPRLHPARNGRFGPARRPAANPPARQRPVAGQPKS